MRNRRFTILACCGLLVAAAVLGCTQTEGKIIPPAPNTLPEGAKLTVMGVGGPGPQKVQGPGVAKATKPSDDKKDDSKKDDAKKGDDKKDNKPGDDKKPADDKKPSGDDKKSDGNKDKP